MPPKRQTRSQLGGEEEVKQRPSNQHNSEKDGERLYPYLLPYYVSMSYYILYLMHMNVLLYA